MSVREAAERILAECEAHSPLDYEDVKRVCRAYLATESAKPVVTSSDVRESAERICLSEHQADDDELITEECLACHRRLTKSQLRKLIGWIDPREVKEEK